MQELLDAQEQTRREARFFDMFNYDPQTAEWTCLMCNPPGGN